MPPKSKFTREQLIDEALNLVREQGMDALTTRALAKRLGTTVSPIFTVFDNLEALQTEVKQAAKELYGKYIKEGLEEKPEFKGVAKKYILFAKEEPKLFRFLFMSKAMVGKTKDYNPIIPDNYKIVFGAFRETYSLSENGAKRLFVHVGVYLHGLATLFAEKMCDYPLEYVWELLAEMDECILVHIKEEHNN